MDPALIAALAAVLMAVAGVIVALGKAVANMKNGGPKSDPKRRTMPPPAGNPGANGSTNPAPPLPAMGPTLLAFTEATEKLSRIADRTDYATKTDLEDAEGRMSLRLDRSLEHFERKIGDTINERFEFFGKELAKSQRTPPPVGGG